MSHFYIFILLLSFFNIGLCIISEDNQKLNWLMGTWRSEYSGKISWPSVPTMAFGEEIHLNEAPTAKSGKVQFLNFTYVFFFLFIYFFSIFF